ncbi:MAG: hypothetical protein K0U59_07825 [Gammaproteobacteria bacterium]|nr:hypothetical protein [Gammaproteobacteria bacterium]
MTKFTQLMLGIAVIFYPLAVYFGIRYLSLSTLLVLLFGIAVLRLLLNIKAVKDNKAKDGGSTKMVTLALLIVTALSWLYENTLSLLWYPVLCNAILFSLFAYSLRQPQTMIERLARLREPQLSPAGVIYTRKVTQVWCVFFIVNGSVAAFTAIYGNMELWTLYNGLLSYLLMGLLFCGEWLLRHKLWKKDQNTEYGV